LDRIIITTNARPRQSCRRRYETPGCLQSSSYLQSILFACVSGNERSSSAADIMCFFGVCRRGGKHGIMCLATIVEGLTANLDDAIRYLRQHKSASSSLWIDAMCIIRDLTLERHHKVGLVNRIYSSADQVLIWLGSPCQDSEFIFETLSCGTLKKCDMTDLLLQWRICCAGTGRLWIAQELTLCQQDPIVYYGCKIVTWGAFVLSIEVIKDRIQGVANPLHCRRLPTFTFVNITRRTHHFRSYPPAVVARAETVLHPRDMRNAGFNHLVVATSHDSLIWTL
jgi:hypothetical protein